MATNMQGAATGTDGPILVFDSGVGGLTVAREIRRLLPAISLTYLADDAGFSYGDWEEAALIDHISALVGDFVAKVQPRAVVVACNTASTLVLPRLRAELTIPVVGTVPAIKPAAEQTESGQISVLATPGTVRREYTRSLISQFASEISVNLVGSRHLSAIAEDKLAGRPVDLLRLKGEVEACFVSQNDKKTDTVVLACTHYPLLLEELEQVSPWPVRWIDPAPAIARRVCSVLISH